MRDDERRAACDKPYERICPNVLAMLGIAILLAGFAGGIITVAAVDLHDQQPVKCK